MGLRGASESTKIHKLQHFVVDQKTTLTRRLSGFQMTSPARRLARRLSFKNIKRHTDKLPATSSDDEPRALCDAAQLGDVIRLQTLLRHGADVNTPSQDGCTPALVYAASNGQTECVRMLLEAGANANAGDSLGNTALFKASCYNHKQCAHLLLQSGADPSKANKWGAIPLQLAALQGYTTIVDLLMQYGANVSRPSCYASDRLPPPLVAATTRCHLTCMKLLLSNASQDAAEELDSSLTVALYYFLSACAGFQRATLHASTQDRAECVNLLLTSGTRVTPEHLRITCYPYFVPVVNLQPYVTMLKQLLHAAPYDSRDHQWNDVMMLLFGHVTRLGQYKWELVQLMCSIGFVPSEDLLDGLAFTFTSEEMTQLKALRKTPKSLAELSKQVIRCHVATTNVQHAMTTVIYPKLLQNFVLSNHAL